MTAMPPEAGAWKARLPGFDHVLDAGHLLRCGGIVGCDLAAYHQRTRDDRIFHAGQAHILPIDRASRDDVDGIDDLELAVADVAESAKGP